MGCCDAGASESESRFSIDFQSGLERIQGASRFDFLFEFKEVTMIQELQLRILPEEAVSEQSLKQVVARETGISVPYIHTVRVLKRSIDARQRTIYVNVKLRAFINEQPDEPEFQLVEYKDVSAGKPVVVVGAGPGGLFAALRLIELGLRPIVIERGKNTSDRDRTWKERART